MLSGQLSQLLELDELGDGSVMRRRPGSVCRLAATVGDGRLRLLLGDRELDMPARLAPAVEAILARERFTVGDLAELLDEPSRLVLVRRLVREGLLESIRS
jgi:hypothetical protein